MSTAMWKFVIVFAAIFGIAAGALAGAEIFGLAQKKAEEFAHGARVERSVDWELQLTMHGALVGASVGFLLLWLRARGTREPLTLRSVLLAAPATGYVVGLTLAWSAS